MKKLLLLTLLCSAPLAAMDFVSEILGVYSGDLQESFKKETVKVSQEEQEQLNIQLLDAARNGDIEKVRQALASGANIEAQDQWEMTPLHCAAKNGHQDVVELLIEKGAKIEAQDKGKRTPLHCAASNGYKDVVALLIEKGAKIEVQDQWQKTPLHYAAEYGKTDVVALLIEKGAKIEAQDKWKQTPLYWAARHGQKDVVALLIEKGAKIEAQDQWQRTPLYLAALYGHKDVVALLKAAESLQRGGVKLAFGLINQDWSNLQVFLGCITAHILRQNSVKQYCTQMIKNKNKSNNLKKLFDLTEYCVDFSSYKKFVDTLKLVTPKFVMNRYRNKLEQENMFYFKHYSDCNLIKF